MSGDDVQPVSQAVVQFRKQLRRQTIHLQVMFTVGMATEAGLVWWIVKSAEHSG